MKVILYESTKINVCWSLPVTSPDPLPCSPSCCSRLCRPAARIRSGPSSTPPRDCSGQRRRSWRITRARVHAEPVLALSPVPWRKELRRSPRSAQEDAGDEGSAAPSRPPGPAAASSRSSCWYTRAHTVSEPLTGASLLKTPRDVRGRHRVEPWRHEACLNTLKRWRSDSGLMYGGSFMSTTNKTLKFMIFILFRNFRFQFYCFYVLKRFCSF